MTRRRDASVWALGVGVFLASFLTPLHRPWELAGGEYTVFIGRGFLVVLLALASGVTAAVARWWSWPVQVVALASWLTYSMWPTMAVASFNTGLRWDGRPRSVAFLSLSTFAVVVPLIVGAAELSEGVRFAAVMVALMIIMPYTAGMWIRTRHRLIDELRARNATLAARVRAEERTRIARDMHDVVAHRVALIVLHAGGLEVNAPDELTAREAGLIRTTGREALTELRQLLGVLRAPAEATPPRPLSVDLEELMGQARQAGTPVELRIQGEPRDLPASVESTAYRLVREALTNVVKHAPGAGAEVVLRRIPGFLDVTVTNPPGVTVGSGPGPHPRGQAAARREPLPSSGLGLIGLRERIDLLGGRFRAAPLPDGGFEVSARLPIEGDVLQLPGEDVRRAV